jgi:c-di-GMP-binding flagellar brake protein YcgR
MAIDIPGILDRRQTPRYKIELPVEILLENGSKLTVTARNISSCGLQIICDAWVTEKIDPRGIQNHAVGHIRIKTVTQLPIGDETKKLYAKCRIMSVQRMSQDEFMLNLSFIEFESGSEQILDKFLAQYEQKKIVVGAIV